MAHNVQQMHVFKGSSCCVHCCAYFLLHRPKGWRPQIYDSVFNTYGQGHLMFNLELMNGGGQINITENSRISIQSPITSISVNFVSIAHSLDDFSGPAPSTSFSLGSFVPLKASVEHKTHQPLLLLLEECVATTTPELQEGGNVYPIITNNGY